MMNVIISVVDKQDPIDTPIDFVEDNLATNFIVITKRKQISHTNEEEVANRPISELRI